jgi:signal transduction histidine kinase
MATQTKPLIYKSIEPIRKQISTIFVLAFLFCALVVAFGAPFFAGDWSRQPFLGMFIENGFVTVSAAPSQAGTWEAYGQGVRFGEVLKALDGQSIQQQGDVNNLLKSRKVGETVVLETIDRLGRHNSYQIELKPFPRLDFVTYFLIPYLIGLTYLGVGIWVFSLRRRDTTGKSFAIFTAAISIALMTFFDNYTTHKLVYFWTFAVSMGGGALINMGLFFPQEEENSIFNKFPLLRWAAYVPGILIFLFTVPRLFDFTRPLAFSNGWLWGYIYTALGFVFFIGRTMIRRYRDESPIVREQSRLILWGSVLAFLPVVLYLVVNSITILSGNLTQVAFNPILLTFMVAFALMTAYSIARYRLLETDFLVSQILLFSSLSFLATAGYALIVTGMTIFLKEAFDITNIIIIGFIVFILAFFFLPLRERVQLLINRIFGRSQAAYREQMQSFSREITQALDVPAVIGTLRRNIQESIAPIQSHIYLYDPLLEQYVPTTDGAGRATSDLYFSPTSPLANMLSQQRESLYLGEVHTLPLALKPDSARLSLLGAQLYVPLQGRTRLAGWLALGPRISGEPYGSRDLNLLEALADQAALAVERAQVVSDLERRVHAMNVLTRISQGVNVTSNFDDILELIYAQTNLIIPVLDFHITLADIDSQILYHVFFLENDERLSERENQPLPLNQGLEQEIIRTRRPIVTADYERECRGRGILPATKGIFSWIGVPLNTGAETIGVISLGSRDAAIIYTEEQSNLLQAIADQAAGAIVKARLLQEAERRARQLTMLNEIARSLSSTLELAPLFNQILNSAVEILNCEAGSLLLVDQHSGDLVFEAAVGPVAENLMGQRLPPGTGLVGKAVDTQQAFIVNDVRRTKDWFEQSDQRTGFTTNDLLVVPMIYKENVTGVVEVINRKDGRPFTNDDQELLTAFSSQAAVALENARLYTQTDQTLAARVDELSMMQRIDRELNASLDVNRAMRLTLDWAMRQSRANAGLVGIIDQDSVRVMAHQGYTTEALKFEKGLSTEFPSITASIETGLPQFITLDGDREASLLMDAKEQLVVPIQRENVVVGLLLLESRESGSYSEDNLAFLTRLMDHASIAIANAQLYSEVQQANLAKSEFVSFVSHELKTPMTSIRGFADLLAAGVVGPVNDNQSNFLSTIRSNVDRMATLVTDLADISRIEAGRLRLDFEPVRITDVIEDVTRSLIKLIEEKKQALNVNIPDDLPPVWGDKNRLIQVVTNLVSNAYKYSPPENPIFIKAELAENIWTDGSPKVVHLSVQDTGFGISPENQKKIFQKFFRSDDQKVRDAPGTGLGLNITKQLVEMQGGLIWFESVFRSGTTFHVIMPIAEVTG